jgi:hypothetical protein
MILEWAAGAPRAFPQFRLAFGAMQSDCQRNRLVLEHWCFTHVHAGDEGMREHALAASAKLTSFESLPTTNFGNDSVVVCRAEAL